jgi:hypothetical protein
MADAGTCSGRRSAERGASVSITGKLAAAHGHDAGRRAEARISSCRCRRWPSQSDEERRCFSDRGPKMEVTHAANLSSYSFIM